MNATTETTKEAGSPASRPASSNATMKRYLVKVSYKLFHNDSGGRFAQCVAVCEPTTTGHRVRLTRVVLDEEALLHSTKGGSVHDWTLRNFRQAVAATVHKLLNDPDGLKFPIRWDEDTCLECEFKAM